MQFHCQFKLALNFKNYLGVLIFGLLIKRGELEDIYLYGNMGLSHRALNAIW